MTWLLRLVGVLLVSLIALGAIVWLNFDWVRYNAVIWVATPGKPFAEPKAFDYAGDDGWAALPARGGNGPAVDVFLVHGTTYFRPYQDSWNQSADDTETNKITSQLVVGNTMFDGCCRVYVPRFRQAILGAFADETGNGQQALGLAYGDVERAFDYFIEHHNNGRPFILAGGSQGSRHIFGLLKNRISGTDLRKRMIAAYPLIWWMKKDQFAKDAPDIPVCSEPTQTGCVATFNPVGPHLRTGLNPIFDQTGIICVNPLTWRTNGAYAGFELNIGARTFKSPDKLIPGAADAKCDESGRLVVSEIRADMYEGVPLAFQLVMGLFGRDNYHSIAGGLFYGNLKRNVQERVDTFIAQEAPQ